MEQNRGNFILVLEGLFLLLAPCLEHQPCGQELDSENLTGKIAQMPLRDDIDLTIEENLIVEFYSR